jgi:hypothetical protein
MEAERICFRCISTLNAVLNRVFGEMKIIHAFSTLFRNIKKSHRKIRRQQSTRNSRRSNQQRDEGPMTRGQMSVQSRQELSTFILTAVLPKTNRVYEKEWDSFKAFVIKETGSDDPFLKKSAEDELATLVALMMMITRMRMRRPGSGERPPLRSRQRCARCMPG